MRARSSLKSFSELDEAFQEGAEQRYENPCNTASVLHVWVISRGPFQILSISDSVVLPLSSTLLPQLVYVPVKDFLKCQRYRKEMYIQELHKIAYSRSLSDQKIRRWLDYSHMHLKGGKVPIAKGVQSGKCPIKDLCLEIEAR